MFTWGPKYLFAVSLTSLVVAVAYGIVTGGDPIGVLTAGYKGGVGDHLGYTILLGVFLVTQVLTWVLIATRDGDAEALAFRVGSDVVPPVAPPVDASYWGVVTGFGVGCLVVGLAVSQVFFVLGLAVLFVAGLMWMVLAWSDRATGDPAANRVIRNRITGPFEIPMLSILGFGIIVIAMSRVFIAVSATGAVVFGGIVTVVVFGGAVLLSKVDVKPAIVRGALVLGAVGVLAAGIAGAVAGERDFHHHGEETHSEEIEGEGE